jgi:ornithine--oxo-acid transaminase
MLEIPIDNTTTTPPGWGRSYLMCSPDHFEVAYAINPWMNLEVKVDQARAQAQWDELVATLRSAGADVQTIEPQEGLPDMVFTANAGLVVGDTFVPAAMRNPERRDEQAHFADWFAARGHRVRGFANGTVQEGAGDALPFGGRLVGGWRTRSSAEAYPEVARLTGASTAAVELVDPRFYHLDLAFCPLGEGRAMVVPSALSEAGRAVLSELATEPLLLDAEEGAAFCANSVVVGDTVVMPACPPRVRRHLEEWGLTPVVVDVGEFLKAGGAVRCLTLALDVQPEHVGAEPAPAEADPIELAERHGAHNYHPLPVSIARAEGSWVWDADERPYLDALSAYSALNFGHRHPRLTAAAHEQLDRVTLTSRAFHNDELGPFCRELAELCGKDRVLPMNTGAEAVETALKVVRKWGRLVKGVPADRAKIVVCDGNFHGRTITIVSFSDDPLARDDFGPFTPGFESIPFGDAGALRRALEDDDVVAFLFEPVQGEAGVVIPPDGWLREVRSISSERGVLMIADEIQSGLGRTGRTFACDHEGVEPDVYVLGKALGGGIVPLSAVVAGDEVLGVLRPGEHGSTFGGNPLACAIGREVVRMVGEGEHQERSARLGEQLLRDLREADLHLVERVRGRGLWLGIDIVPGGPSARELCERLMRRGLLCKDTHESTIRLAPPLTIEERELEFLLDAVRAELG